MTAEGRQGPSVSEEAGGMATSGAALIATFYGRRDDEPIRNLCGLLCEHFGPRRVLCFDLPGQVAHDATALQVGINAPGDDVGAADDSWEGLRGEIERTVDAGDLGKDGIWGYTLVYQAVVGEGHDAEEVLERVLPGARRLHRGGDPARIRTFGVAGGLACLAGVPGPVGGPDAGMVYVILGPREGEEAILAQFYSLSANSFAKLLPPDLIAHKGYHQMRQYRTGDLESKYQESVADLQKTADGLLKDLPINDEDPVGFDESGAKERLDDLFGLYCRLLPVVSSFKELQVGMSQQAYNLDKWRSRFGDNEALEFHQDHLETAIRETESKVEPLRLDLEIADKAVSTARLQLDREQADRREEAEREENRNQQLIQTLLVVVALALALPELIDREVAGRVIGWIGGVIPALEPYKGSTFAQFGLQFVVVAIPIGWAGVRLWLHRRRKGRASEGG